MSQAHPTSWPALGMAPSHASVPPAAPHLRLAESLRGLREVQDVVDDLEGQAQVATVLEHRVLHARVIRAAEHCRRLAAGRDQRGRLVEAFVHVLVERQVCVKQAVLLADLAVREVRYHLADQLDHLQSPKASRHQARTAAWLAGKQARTNLPAVAVHAHCQRAMAGVVGNENRYTTWSIEPSRAVEAHKTSAQMGQAFWDTHLKVIQVGQEPRGLGKQEVADQHRNL
jgi:hypothetical protein